MFRAFVMSSPYGETDKSDLYAYTSAIIDMEILFFLILRQKSLLFLCSFFQNTGRRTDKRIDKNIYKKIDKRIDKGTDKRTDIKNEFKNELME